MKLRIADLRKRRNITQKELSDVIGTTFQTISRWENGTSMPDITVLPAMADYFNVTVDQLLGLTPLEDEVYISEETGQGDFWNGKLEYLLATRKNYWNEDYVEFLVKQVWKIEKPVSVLDCGCGFGFMGLLLLPYLPDGSTYTGIDIAKDLIEEGKKIYSISGINATFFNVNIHDFHRNNFYDVVISQAVLRHLDEPEHFIKEMIDKAKPGGYVISMDSNREFECDGLYVDGMDYQKLCMHSGLEKKWKTELDSQGRDYAIAIRTAHIMKKLGLQEVDVRMNDKINFITSQLPDFNSVKSDFIKYNLNP